MELIKCDLDLPCNMRRKKEGEGEGGGREEIEGSDFLQHDRKTKRKLNPGKHRELGN